MRTSTAEKRAEQVEQEHEHHAEHRAHGMSVESAMRVPELVPSPLYVGLSLGSIIASLALYQQKHKEDAIFVGLWAPTILALGMFAKLAGIRRSEETESGE